MNRLMKPFVVYDLATGSILRTGAASTGMWKHQSRHGEGVTPGHADQIIHRMDLLTGQVVPRMTAVAVVDRVTVPADKVTKLKISGIPTGTVVEARLDGLGVERISVDDGELVVTLDLAGLWTFVLHNGQYMKQEFEVVAT